ncbi:unnamed protein product [Trichobilharzia regenti]|nr:unnamed protein product [Trichobilharzia regenti]
MDDATSSQKEVKKTLPSKQTFLPLSWDYFKFLLTSLKAIGEDEKAFIIQNFSVRDLPSWVYFPDVERAEWLNKVIKRMWPAISEYARDIVIQNIVPIVSQNLPAALTPFSFETIDLGDTPPRVGGIKVYMNENIRKDEIVLDLDLMLYSDVRIKVNLGKVKAGVKEFEVHLNQLSILECFGHSVLSILIFLPL